MIKAVRGRNFSGRSEYIRERTFFGNYAGAKPPRERYAYFDLQVPSYFSGIASTTAEELALSTIGEKPIIHEATEHIIRELDFHRLRNQNPYVLSGGEQSVLGTLIALLLEPLAIGIDCALEQLSAQWRSVIIPAINLASSTAISTYVADNRFDEFDSTSSALFDDAEMKRPADTGATLKQHLPLLILEPCRFAISDLHFRYPHFDNKILSSLDFEFIPGTVYQLAGPNGAGKSTLSRLLAGLLKPSRGKFWADGGPVFDLTRRPGRHFAYHFQNPDYQLFSVSVRREIEISFPATSCNIHDWLECFGLSGVSESHPLDLPYALRKRLALAATFAMQRPWVILDEPSLGQDQDTVRAICQMCRNYAQQGGGVVVISHSRELAEVLRPVKITLQAGKLC